MARRGRDAGALHREIATPGMRVGLFGGSFNPPHEGHVHVAEAVLKRLALDRIWWLVSPQNPLKRASDTAGLDERLAAVRALARNPRFTVSDIESRIGSRVSVDTIAHLRRARPATRFVWIIGADNLARFHLWDRWTEIAEKIPIVVVARPGSGAAARRSLTAQRYARQRASAHAATALVEMKPPAWLYLPVRLHPASSTAIRKTRSSYPPE